MRRQAEAGITLIEIMVVLAVIGIATGTVMMTVGDRDARAEAEALRLARHLSLGVDEALIGGMALALRWDTAGYVFVQMPAGGAEVQDWPAADLPALAQRHDLPGALQMSLREPAGTGPILVPPSGIAATSVFAITGSDPVWTVTFDGFAAQARPEPSP